MAVPTLIPLVGVGVVIARGDEWLLERRANVHGEGRGRLRRHLLEAMGFDGEARLSAPAEMDGHAALPSRTRLVAFRWKSDRGVEQVAALIRW